MPSSLETFMSKISNIAVAIAGVVVATQAFAQVTFFERDSFGGRSYSTQDTVANLASSGFNDRASSAIVDRDRWEVCEDAAFRGRCMVLRPGRYPSLAEMGLNDRISSLRPVSSNTRFEDDRYAPQPVPAYDGRRRQGERLYEANVTAVRAVVGPPQQRCWMEREQVSQQQERGDASVPGGIVGALIGGIIGHQIGGGTGRGIATVGGVVAGAAVGANLGRDNGGRQAVTQDVQRCRDEANQGAPAYWDVTYEFRGREHHMQVTSPPGATVTVNRQGEPRA
jgi:uncharacterized protein YcfJ